MTSLVLDGTTPGTLFVGVIAGSRRRCQELPLPDHRFETLLLAVDRYLRRQKTALRSVNRCIVVNGPGRFSSLRIAAVIANTFAWDTGMQLAIVRRPTVSFASSMERLSSYERRARSVSVVRPYYGQPPSITKPKKRR